MSSRITTNLFGSSLTSTLGDSTNIPISVLNNNFINEVGDSMSGDLNMFSNKITNLPNPTDLHEPATKQYVDNQIQSVNNFTTDITLNNNTINLDTNQQVTFQNVNSNNEDIIISNSDRFNIRNKNDENIANFGSDVINLNNIRVTGIGNTQELTDCATKFYVDSVLSTKSNFNNDIVLNNNILQLDNSGNSIIQNLEFPSEDQILLRSDKIKLNNNSNQQMMMVQNDMIDIRNTSTAENKILRGLLNPVNDEDGASKKYVDDELASKSIFNNEIKMNNNKINLGDLISDSYIQNEETVNEQKVVIASDTIEFRRPNGNRTMQITNAEVDFLNTVDSTTKVLKAVGSPSHDYDAANKIYTDTLVNTKQKFDNIIEMKNNKLILGEGNTDSYIQNEEGVNIQRMLLGADEFDFTKINNDSVFKITDNTINCLTVNTNTTKQIKNISNPTDNNDAVNKTYLETELENVYRTLDYQKIMNLSPSFWISSHYTSSIGDTTIPNSPVDISGNGISSTQGTFTYSTNNGRGLILDRTNQIISSSSFDTNFSIFAVIMSTNPLNETNSRLISFSNLTNSMVGYWNDKQSVFYLETDLGSTLTRLNRVINTLDFVGLVSDGKKDCYEYENNNFTKFIDQANLGTNNIGSISLGIDAGSFNDHGTGEIYEVICFDKTLTVDEINIVRDVILKYYFA